MIYYITHVLTTSKYFNEAFKTSLVTPNIFFSFKSFQYMKSLKLYISHKENVM